MALDDVTKNLAEQRLRRIAKRNERRNNALVLAALATTIGLGSFLSASSGKRYVDENISHLRSEVAQLQTQLSDTEDDRDYFINLYDTGVANIQQSLSSMEHQLTGIGSLLAPIEMYVDGLAHFRQNPRSADEFERLMAQAGMLPEDMNEAVYQKRIEEHGLANYLPGGEPIIPGLIPPVASIEDTIITSEYGMRNFYLLGRDGSETYLGSSFHGADDMVNKDRRLIANKEGRVVVFDDLDRLPEGTYLHDNFGSLGRTLVVEYLIYNDGGDFVGKYQEFYGHLDRNSNITWKRNDVVEPGDLLGVMGNTGGYSTGIHLHWQVFWKDEASDRWITINPFATNTYDNDQRVYFTEDTLPDNFRKLL